jgi:hypothetical protein
MVAHLWANRAQSDARNGRGNLYFHNETIYSYGSHFPIARWVNFKGKPSVVFLTVSRYSNTTTGHISIVCAAIPPGFDVFEVPEVQGLNHKANLKSYRERIDKLALRASRARISAKWYADKCRELCAEANKYAKLFKLKARFKVPNNKALGEICRKARNADRRYAAKLKRAKAARLAELAPQAEQWNRGERDSMSFEWPDVMLRVRGSRLQTSKGAAVDLESAKRLLPLIRAGKVWKRNGEQIAVGDFQLDSIDEAGNVEIGCHLVKRAEIDRIAAQLGL